jgi:hypothetical protein
MMNELITLYLAGNTISELSRRSGISYGTLRQRLLKHGVPPRGKGYRTETDMERFHRLSIPEPNSGCWLWLGQIDKNGYGKMSLQGEKTTAQRAAWILLCGAIPEAFEVDHLCKNRSCVNPDHLQTISKIENLAQRELRRTHCYQGHLLDGDNIIYERNGTVRRCRLCRQAGRLKYGH